MERMELIPWLRRHTSDGLQWQLDPEIDQGGWAAVLVPVGVTVDGFDLVSTGQKRTTTSY